MHGYDLMQAADGVECIEMTKSTLPDLILLDVMMPRMDGIEATRRLKADPGLPFIPIILVTAKADTKDVVAGLDAGADEYLTKPVDQMSLVARVKSMLRVKELHDKVAAQAVDLANWNQTLEQRVAEQLTQIDRMGKLRRFLSPQVTELILSSGDDRVLDSHRREITVVFCDMRGFTAFSEIAEPEEVMKVLGEYHHALGTLIYKYEGTLERFAGDGLMILFNDPLQYDDHALRAVKMAVEMRDAVADAGVRMEETRPRSWLRRRHSEWIRDARTHRVRRTVRLRRGRHRRQSRGAAMFRGARRPDPDRAQGQKSRRGSRRDRRGRKPDAQGPSSSCCGI